MELDPFSPPPTDGTMAVPPRPPPPRDLPDAMPLWRLYWFALGTFGIYLPIWIYRTAKRMWGGRPSSDTPVWWAFGFFAPPACAAILIDFARRAGLELRHDGIPRHGATGVPALLYFAILLIGNYGPLNVFLPALLFLLPLPFLMIQRTINRVHAGSYAPAVPPGRQVHPAEWIGVSFGTTALVVLIWAYSPELRQMFALRQGAGTTIAGHTGRFTVTLPSDRWRVVEPGTIADEGSDLELIGPGVDSWLIAYTHDPRRTGFEEVIDFRRWQFRQTGTLTSLRESRRFLNGADLIPISVAEYEVHAGVQGTWSFVVLTAQLNERIIELIGHSAEPGLYLEELRALSLSFRPVAQDQSS